MLQNVYISLPCIMAARTAGLDRNVEITSLSPWLKIAVYTYADLRRFINVLLTYWLTYFLTCLVSLSAFSSQSRRNERWTINVTWTALRSAAHQTSFLFTSSLRFFPTAAVGTSATDVSVKLNSQPEQAGFPVRATPGPYMLTRYRCSSDRTAAALAVGGGPSFVT